LADRLPAYQDRFRSTELVDVDNMPEIIPWWKY